MNSYKVIRSFSHSIASISFTLLVSISLLLTTNQLNAQVSLLGDSVYTTVDVSPKYSHGNLQKKINKLKQYPTNAMLKGLEQVVVVDAIITNEGKLVSAKVVTDADSEFAEEALRVVLTLKEWSPAKRSNQNVNCSYSIPISFSLNPDEKEFASAFKGIDFDKESPLFILDGKKVGEFVSIPAHNVRSIRILKGNKAIDLYGDNGRYGVVEMTTKNGTPPLR